MTASIFREAFSSSLRMYSFNVMYKLVVKVVTRTLSLGFSSFFARNTARCMSATVLPVPAAPLMFMGPLVSHSTSFFWQG